MSLKHMLMSLSIIEDERIFPGNGRQPRFAVVNSVRLADISVKKGLVIGLLRSPNEGSDSMCNQQVKTPVFTIALVLCSMCASASDLTEQVKEIQNLEQDGHLLQAIIETSQLIDALTRSDPQSSLIPEALDERASLEQDLGKWADAEHDYAEAISLWEAAAVPGEPGDDPQAIVNSCPPPECRVGCPGRLTPRQAPLECRTIYRVRPSQTAPLKAYQVRGEHGKFSRHPDH